MSSILSEIMVYGSMIHYLYVVIGHSCRSMWSSAIVLFVCGYLQGVVLCVCWWALETSKCRGDAAKIFN